tara:strand:+ start:813 stop:1046 length:234 start_codon:yes stop_codon:yes gene_type:complete
MGPNIVIGIYVKDGRVDNLILKHPLEGQVDARIIYQTDYPLSSDESDPRVCKEEQCPEMPRLHRHDYFSITKTPEAE